MSREKCPGDFQNIQRLCSIFNAISNAIIVIDKEGLIVMVNWSWAKIVNLPITEIVGKHIDQVVPNNGLKKVLQTRNTETSRQIVINGCKYISNRSPVLEGGEIVGAVAVLQNTTELRGVLEELADLKEIKELLEIILENAYDGVVMVDEQAKITFLNQAYCDFLGVNQVDAIGKHVVEVIENTRMHVVVQTGKAEIGEVQQIKGRNIVCKRIPIVKDNRIVGAVGKVLFQDVSDLNALVDKVNKMQNQLVFYQDELKRYRSCTYNLKSIVGENKKILELKEMVGKLSKSNSSVLIRGESGTGKELFAHAIHDASNRSAGPFVKVNCAALPENLLESELFGYREGAFTGASKRGKSGKFELAHQGTIFLDEIGDMPLSMQAKLLRVLQEMEIEPLGSNKSIKVDVRVITATNQDLEQLIARKEFREDLYYRLNVVALEIPPMRERIDDIPNLAEALVAKLGNQLGCGHKKIHGEVYQIFAEYHWPGNIRELENVLERALNLVDGDEIAIKHLPYHLQKDLRGEIRLGDKPLREIINEFEKEHIIKALEECNYDCLKAAKILGIGKSTIYDKIMKYNISIRN
jgi:PAS domain S-box-containing protein